MVDYMAASYILHVYVRNVSRVYLCITNHVSPVTHTAKLVLFTFVTDGVWLTGAHAVDVEYAGQHVPGSPFYVGAYDIGGVRVGDVSDGIVGRRSSFTGTMLVLLYF